MATNGLTAHGGSTIQGCRWRARLDTGSSAGVEKFAKRSYGNVLGLSDDKKTLAIGTIWEALLDSVSMRTSPLLVFVERDPLS